MKNFESVEKNIKSKIKKELPGSEVEVRNNSSKHSKKIKEHNAKVSHIEIKIQSDALMELDILKRNRKVHEILKEEFTNIHSISVSIVPLSLKNT